MPEPLPSPSLATDARSPAPARTPPGPRGLPWLGCAPALLADPLRFWCRIARRFGGIASIRLKGNRRILFVSEPRLIKELLLDRLEYLGRVLNESLRLYSPIHAVSRTALENNEIGGYEVPSGCTVAVSMHATHRLPGHWPDPERFDPERFLPEACAARSNFAYIPFAVGQRNCIGGTLAILESKLILALMAQRYRLDLAPGEKVEAYPGTTMRPRNGLRMVVSPS